MRYLCLIYGDPQLWAALSPSEHDAMVNEHLAHDESLRRSGHYIEAEALQPADTATTVRTRRGQPSFTGGPFVETNEQLGGFYLIEARDLNEALRVAGSIPSARLGSVEVRPVRELVPT
jgi:hypothetical protein